MSLVTNANYLYYLGVDQSTTITNTLTPLISAVEKRVKEYLNRDIEITAYTDELYDGNGTSKLVLRQFPIVSVSAIKRYDGIASGNVETWTTLVEHTDYDRLIIPKEAYSVILDNGAFDKGIQNYKITYIAGFGTVGTGSTLTNAIPDDIQNACKELLKITYANSPISGDGRLGMLSINANAGGGSQSLNIDPDIEEKILKKIAYHKALNV